MAGFIQTAAIGISKAIKAGAKEVVGTLDDTVRLAQGGRHIDPTAVAERFERMDGAYSVFDNAIHLNNFNALDAVEGVVTPSAFQLIPHAANQIGLINKMGLPAYTNLIRTTTPNPLPALRETFDSVRSIFSRNG
jgi:hypothetical protein